MFERFTGRARHVVVLAQEEARGLQHNYIGTEHLLLGLFGEPGCIASRALSGAGVTADMVRDAVIARIGLGKKAVRGHIPFTPRAKKVLELALREALSLHHNYIGTEHLLLGIIRENGGVAAEILRAQAGDLGALRRALLAITPPGESPGRRGWFGGLLGRGGEGVSHPTADVPDLVRTTGAADVSLEEARSLAGDDPIGSHHLLLAALGDPDNAAARALASLGVDLDRARDALRQASVAGTTDELPEQAGRRRMLIRVAEDRVIVEAADETLLRQAHHALESLPEQSEQSEQSGAADVIAGELPESVSLAEVWLALRASLEDIQRRGEIAAGSGGSRSTGLVG